jgi:hypothetical protein
MVFQPLKNLSELRDGDIIRHINETRTLVVTGNYGTYVIAVRTWSVTNPSEWEVLRPQFKFRDLCSR